MDLNPNLDELIKWFHTFDPYVLQNEDDVETKFVIPMFECLGYTTDYRRGKFPINAYNPNRSGRKPEADIVYFSSEKKDEQNENTALLLIEAKEPNKQNIKEDVNQALFYSEHLKPLFYVITNGIHILIYERHRYRRDECLFNCSIDALKDSDSVMKLYKRLNFNVVKKLKEAIIDEVTNSLYTEIMRLLKEQPDLVAQIEKGDFKEHTFEDEQHQKITISRPKVALECELPFVLRGGSCRIEFSNVMLRGLICQLTHEDIVQNLLIGLNTPPHWNTRCFIHQSSDGTFIAQLGRTTVLLSEQEAEDLCTCIDFIIGERYKKTMSMSEVMLESWEYNFKQTYEIPGYASFIRGFSLLSVKPWLWQLMMQFARSFDYDEGNTAWHIFETTWNSIRIHVHENSWTNVVLWAIAEETGDKTGNEWLSILYYDPDEEFEFYDGKDGRDWKAYIGPQGIWTVKYTQEWIVNQFIPKIVSHYRLDLEDYQSPFLRFQEWLAETIAPKVFMGYQKHLNQEKQKKLDKFLKDSISVEKYNEYDLISEVNEFKQLQRCS